MDRKQENAMNKKIPIGIIIVSILLLLTAGIMFQSYAQRIICARCIAPPSISPVETCCFFASILSLIVSAVGVIGLKPWAKYLAVIQMVILLVFNIYNFYPGFLAAFVFIYPLWVIYYLVRFRAY